MSSEANSSWKKINSNLRSNSIQFSSSPCRPLSWIELNLIFGLNKFSFKFVCFLTQQRQFLLQLSQCTGPPCVIFSHKSPYENSLKSGQVDSRTHYFCHSISMIILNMNLLHCHTFSVMSTWPRLTSYWRPDSAPQASALSLSFNDITMLSIFFMITSTNKSKT